VALTHAAMALLWAVLVRATPTATATTTTTATPTPTPTPATEAEIVEPPQQPSLARERGLSPVEEAACAGEIQVVERRRRLFRSQGLTEDEVAERNAPAEAQLALCARREREERALLAEVERRTPPRATEQVRAAVAQQLRLDRARARSAEERTEEDRRLLAAEAAREEQRRRGDAWAASVAAEVERSARAGSEEEDPEEKSLPDLARERSLGPDEQLFCAAELRAIAQRLRLFEAQGLPPAERRKRNAPAETALGDCRARFRQARRHDEERRHVQEEIVARTPVGANELERARIAREVRVARARARKEADLLPEERTLLAEADAEEGRRRETEARARDPRLYRQLLSGERCAHAGRLERHRRELAEEDRLSTLGGGDRQRGYFLQAEVKRDEEVLERNQAELARAGGPLPCSDPVVLRVAQCIDGQIEGREEPVCRSEELRAALRLLAQ